MNDDLISRPSFSFGLSAPAVWRACLWRQRQVFLFDVIMQTLKVEPASNGNLWVTLPYSETGVARIKRIPGHRWNPERKQWQLPDTPATRAALAELVAMPPAPPLKILAVKPKNPHPCPPPSPKGGDKGGRGMWQVGINH